MERFAFVIHPIDVRKDAARALPIAAYLPIPAIEAYMLRRKPFVAAHVTGIRSVTGTEAEGWLIGCPLSPRQFVTLPVEMVYERLQECARMAEALGAPIMGLGAFSSVAGDGGVTLAQRVPIAITTGNSYTVATALEGCERAADLMRIDLRDAVAAVVGATGSIGATCAEVLGRTVRELVLVGRSAERLEALAERLRPGARGPVRVSTDVGDGLHDADVVVTVSSAADAIIQPRHIKRGAVVCDVARPRDVSVAVARERDDVLVIEGGVVRVPGAMRAASPRSGREFSFGFPQGTAYACMSETMALALDRRYESFTLGKTVSVAQVDEIGRICARHGFTLDGFRTFERALGEDEMERIRAAAGR